MESNDGRTPLAILEGRPIFVDDILYDLNGVKFKASTTSHRDFPMCLINVATIRENTYSSWVTGTHWKGQQILFWNVNDIPAPHEQNLYMRLKTQADACKARRKRPMSTKRGRKCP